MTSHTDLQLSKITDGTAKYNFNLGEAAWNGYSTPLQQYFFNNSTKAAMISGDQTLFISAIGKWMSICNFSITQGSYSAGEDMIVIVRADMHDDAGDPDDNIPSPSAGDNDGVYHPTSGTDGGEVYIHSGIDVSTPYGFYVAMHEFGHALGLDHPNGDGYAEGWDVTKSIMSYNEIEIDGQTVYPSTPMYYDIMAVQDSGWYDTIAAAVGNSTYTLSGNAKLYTIWDSGGTDTLDASAYNGGSITMDLREGFDGDGEHYTELGSERMYIAHNVVIEDGYGGSGADTITGNSSANVLQGNGSADSLYGGLGVDKLYGGSGADKLFGEDDNDELLNGGADNDTIDGGPGDDHINGDSGDDELTGGSGNDWFEYGTYQITPDHITDFASGADKVLFPGSPVLYFPVGQMESCVTKVNDGAQVTAANANFPSLIITFILDGLNPGSVSMDDFLYTSGSQYLSIFSHASGATTGNDNISGSSGADTYHADKGNDTIAAAGGNDLLYGSFGDDVIKGEAGTDTLYGNDGADVFKYAATSESTSSGADVIEDFVQGTDLINLAGLGFTGIASGAASGTTLGYSSSGGVTTITDTGTFMITLTGNFSLTGSDFAF